MMPPLFSLLIAFTATDITQEDLLCYYIIEKL